VLGRSTLTTVSQRQPHSPQFGSEEVTMLLLKDGGRFDAPRQRPDPRGE
jgi:hypothetical protein